MNPRSAALTTKPLPTGAATAGPGTQVSIPRTTATTEVTTRLRRGAPRPRPRLPTPRALTFMAAPRVRPVMVDGDSGTTAVAAVRRTLRRRVRGRGKSAAE